MGKIGFDGLVSKQAKKLNECIFEATEIITQLNRKIRLEGLKQKSRVNQSKNINVGFENAVKQHKHKPLRSNLINFSI
jgi:hypothetical protein